MFPPFPDKEQWLVLYSQLFDLLFERNLGDDLVVSFAADLQEAWLRAVNLWNQSPEKYLSIQNEWNDALDHFNDAVNANTNQNDAINHLKQLHSKLGLCLSSLIIQTPDISESDQRLLLFGMRHLVNAMSPDYWPVANNEVMETFYNTGGTSFMQGLKTLQDDINDSVIGLDVKTALKDDFKVGETLAITPGEVIYQNRLFQLIQYYPCSQEVYSTPLLIVPPWINKFYVLDLTPANSFVQWAVRQGYTVFMISWINPGSGHRDLTLSDYLVDGCSEAMDKVKELAGSDQINLIGYCIGGLLAACCAAYQSRRNNKSVRTLTLLNTMLDHSEPGDIGVFLSRRMLAALEKRLDENDVLDGRILRQTFTMLREDRMFWPYIVNNYLLGKPPKPDPVLYWNQDATNLPLPMLIEIIKYMYQENVLVDSSDYALAGEKMSIKSINAPVFLLACKGDHIVPWKSAYKSVFQFDTETEFILSEGGHVMGVMNSPNKKRGGYLQLRVDDFPEDPEMWLEHARLTQGSWWEYWYEWISGRQNGRVHARFPGQHGTQVIERAPGSYVTMQYNVDVD